MFQHEPTPSPHVYNGILLNKATKYLKKLSYYNDTFIYNFNLILKL